MKCKIIFLSLFFLALASGISGEADDCEPNDNQSDERFVAVRVDQLGVDELNPDLQQIQDIVNPFLPPNYKYLYALNATREIVNGFKYEIIFVMKNEQNDEVCCEMDVLEKPWLVKDSKKFRKMTYNNCSLENSLDDEDRMRTEYDVNPIFVNQRTQLTEDDVRDMEDQIVGLKPKATTTEIAEEEEEETTLTPLNPSSKNLLDDFFNMNNYFPPPQLQTTTAIPTTLPPELSNFNMDALDEMFGLKKVANSQAAPKVNDDAIEDDKLHQQRVENVASSIPTKNETALKDLEMEIKKVFSELFQSDPEFQMNIIALINRKDDSTAQKNYNYVISILASKLKDKIEMYNVKQQVESDELQVTVDPLSESGDIRRKRSAGKEIWDVAEEALDTLDHFDFDDKKRILLNILSVKQANGQMKYKIEATIANSHCQENSHETSKCIERIDLDSMKICLLEINENGEKLTNSQCAPLKRERRQLGGLGAPAPFDVDHEDVKLYLSEALIEINASDEPDYTVKKVIEATRQVVSGFATKFKVLLELEGKDVTCDFDVWEQGWLPNGRKVKVECDNEKKYNLTQNPVSQRNKVRARRQLGVPGGINPIDVNHEDVQLYLSEALVEINASDEPDYTVKKVIEASTQVVAGSLTRIKVLLTLQEKDVTCDLEVWEQSWIPNGRKVKVECDNEKKYTLTQNPVSQRNKVRARRSNVVGGEQEVEKDDEKVLDLLSTHLKRLDTGSEGSFNLVSVEKVTKQVVAGLKYRVKGSFKAGEDEPKPCTVEIWTRPWIEGDEGTQIKAECDDGVRLKTKRSKRSIRPMPGRHSKFDSEESTDVNARELKSEVLFEHFVKKYHRRYANELEHKMRLRIFKKNLHKIDMLNKHEQGTAKYAITPFADHTEKEYLHKTGLVLRDNENELRNPIAEIPDIELEDLPEEFDWTEKSAVTSVKNQGNCGSCWSFSVTGNIEGLHAIKTGKLEAYSEQELLDCDTKDNACNGGYMDDAFKAIETIGGLELEDEYPYKAKKQKKCLFNQTLSHVKVKGVVDMPKGDEVAIQKYLVANGPISIGINAAAMQFYRGGVSHPWKILCRKSDLDHGVLLVGYGIKSYPMFNKTLPYWKIKNSWGPKWGEQGYYRIYRGDNSCGVAEMASSAVLE